MSNQISTVSQIQLKGVRKNYLLGKQMVKALDDINLQINGGDFVSIVGASGSGKSTLLHIMGGLDCPSAGKVVILDHNVTRMNDRDISSLRGRKIGFVFQSFYLQPHLTVLDNLLLPVMFDRRSNYQILRQRAIKLADALGVADKLNNLPKQLSGGQVQRVAIGRSLVNNPAIILADEPTGNLDSANSRAIVGLLKEVNKKLHTTVVIVTHDKDVASQASRTIQLSDGKIIVDNHGCI